MSSLTRIEISLDEQTLTVFKNSEPVRWFNVSSSAKGTGFKNDSYRTPTGNFRIAEMIGQGLPPRTIFRQRVPVGIWDDADPATEDLILSRILWLDGLDKQNANTVHRYIYIHGTNHSELLGSPASHGCIRMDPFEITELFSLVNRETEVEIHPQTQIRGKLFFIDCDSTLSTIEGIDELAKARGSETFAEVVGLTDAAMNGKIPIAEVFARRMELIRPDRAVCDSVADSYLTHLVDGVEPAIHQLKQNGWIPIILSGGFLPLIEPLAKRLGIHHVEAVPLYFNADGSYQAYGAGYPTTRNLGKNEIIREWKAAMNPELVVMMGDGASDLETKPDVDLFIGFGGVVDRPLVRENCDWWLEEMSSLRQLGDVMLPYKK